MGKSLKRRVMGRPLYVKHGEKLKFLLVGGANTILDFTIYGLLVGALGVVAVGANMISTTICMAVSFVLNYRFVWESKKSKRETAPKFVAVSLFSAWIVQSGIIWVVTAIFGGEDLVSLVAKVIGIGVGMISNYLGYKYIFR